MKKLIITILIGFTSILSIGQNFKLKGEIQNPSGKSVYLFIPNEDRTTTFLDSAEIDNNGKFQLTATLEKAVQAVFTDGNENAQLILAPGDDITLTLNTRFFDETILFSGKGSEKYNALISLYLIDEVISQTFLNSLEHKDTTEIIKNFTKSYDDYLLLINDYKKSYPDLDVYLNSVLDNADNYKTGIINYYKTQKELNTFVENLKGQQIIDFKGVDLESKEVNLSSFKGKITVLDFWATWCGPCRAEFPAYKELENQYGEEVNFVSVGVYCKEDDWKKMATDEGFKNNIFLAKDVQDQIKGLRVDFIPRYIVLDENHKIIDGMAPRPSSGALQTYWK